MEKIRIVVGPPGSSITVSVEGVGGRKCLSITDFLSKLPETKTLTGEFYLDRCEKLRLTVPDSQEG